jgi:hypothetical protein
LMPVEYEYDEEKRCLHTRFWGVVTDEDIVCRRQGWLDEVGGG